MKAWFILFVYILMTPFVFGETTITIIRGGKIVSNDILQGSGEVKSENRELAGFNTIQLDISADVTVTRGDKHECVITADDNIIPVILTKTSNKVLHITTQQNYASNQKVKIAIKTPQLRKVKINGSGTLTAMEVLEDKAELVISGSGDITASGQVKEIIASINGSGNLLAENLEAKKATVIINGSGTAIVHARSSLTATVNGSGDIYFTGTPSLVNTSVRGSGNIYRK